MIQFDLTITFQMGWTPQLVQHMEPQQPQTKKPNEKNTQGPIKKNKNQVIQSDLFIP